MIKSLILLTIISVLNSQVVAEYNTLHKKSDPLYGYRANYNLILNKNNEFSFEYSQHMSRDYKVNGIWKIINDTLILESYNDTNFKYPNVVEKRIDTIKNKIIVQCFDGESGEFLPGIGIKIGNQEKMSLHEGKALFNLGNVKNVEVFSNIFLGINHKITNSKTNFFIFKLYHKPYVNNISLKFLIRDNKIIHLINNIPNHEFELSKNE